MIVLIIVLIYIGSVFFNRWLCKLAVQKGHDHIKHGDKDGWFVPIFYTIYILVIVIKLNTKNSWFSGQHWKRLE